jgi:hypothetical protein
MPTAADFIRQHPGKSAKEVMALAKVKGVKIPDINRVYAVRFNERQLEKAIKKSAKRSGKKVRRRPVKKARAVRIKRVARKKPTSEYMTPEIEAKCNEILELVKKCIFAKLEYVKANVSDVITGKG